MSLGAKTRQAIDLILALRNGRFQVFKIAKGREICLAVDLQDEFCLTRHSDKGISVRFEPLDRKDETPDRLGFVSLLRSANEFPFPLDLTPVWEIVVDHLCRLALPQDSEVEQARLFYLIPLNCHSRVWNGLPTKPFKVGATVVAPVGFLEEMMTHMTEAALHLGRSKEPGFEEMYIVFCLDNVTTAIRMVVSRQHGIHRLTPIDIFPLQKPPDGVSGEAKSCEVLVISHDSIDREALKDFQGTLNQEEQAARGSGRPIEVSLTEALAAQLGDTPGPNDGRPVELCLNHIMGFFTAPTEAEILASTPSKFPHVAGASFVFRSSSPSVWGSFFRGCFSNPRYCYRYDSFELPVQSGRSTYVVASTCRDLYSATVEIVGARDEWGEALPRFEYSLVGPRQFL